MPYRERKREEGRRQRAEGRGQKGRGKRQVVAVVRSVLIYRATAIPEWLKLEYSKPQQTPQQRA
jgi:hypothetical protein